MLTIHLTRRFDSTVALRLTCPDSQVFQDSVTALKFEITPRHRTYDPLAKYWIILSEAAAELEQYLQRMITRFSADVVVEVIEEEEAKSARADFNERRKSSSKEQRQSLFDRRFEMTFQKACRTLFVTPTAPSEVIQGAYRALAKLHHPDRGGDERMMRVINDAYEILTAELRKRKAAA